MAGREKKKTVKGAVVVLWERWERTVVLLRGRGRYSIASGYLGPGLPNVLLGGKKVWAGLVPCLLFSLFLFFPFPSLFHPPLLLLCCF
jgi:hypothetical protein